METEQDFYPSPEESKENNNTMNGTPMNSIARKENYLRLLNRIEEISKSSYNIIIYVCVSLVFTSNNRNNNRLCSNIQKLSLRITQNH